VVNVSQGPVITRYELQPAPGIKVSRITSLADDLALALAAEDVRIEAPVPGKPVVGIEVPNKERELVLLRDVLESREFAEHPSPVALALGKDIAGQPVIADLKKWLHVLIAGATGSGKSVCLNCVITSLLFRTTPDTVKLLMIDPKRVELSAYDGIPHLISPVVTDPKKAAIALRWAVGEMERRYELFAEVGVRNIEMYHEWYKEGSPEEEREHLPYVVVIVDELADLMMVAAAEVEDAICRLAQMARAAGMYLIIATQRPSVDVITGLIKANVPSRISFAVSSQVDSRTILDMGGAERLIGKGDMLYYPIGASKPVRAQGAWISDKEVEAVVKYWKEQGEPDYQEDIVEQAPELGLREDEEDELLEDAIRLVVENGQASISMLQRRFRIGYSRAARLIDIMEVRGIVGGYQGSKPREVLVDKAVLEER
jgi:S-DNA-T family DNA segregation ATPase FtsK/SpoIIIE